MKIIARNNMAQVVASLRVRNDRRTKFYQLLKPFNTPLGVAALTLLTYGLFSLLRLVAFGGDVTRFVVASSWFIPLPASASVGLHLTTSSIGYDGQFYYLLALNPFSPVPILHGAHFDVPAYRAQRILYPLLVWALSLGGRPSLVPALLVVVNLLAIAAIGCLGAVFAREIGVAPLWGILLAFYPGLLVSLASDLPEPLALLCVLGGLLCVKRRRWGWAALLLSLAVLARETTALFAAALLMAGLVAGLRARLRPVAEPRTTASGYRLSREQWPGAVMAGSIPLVVAFGWQLILLLRWGSLGILASGTNNLGIPLVGLVEGVVGWTVLWTPIIRVVQVAALGYLVGMAEMARRTLSSHRRAIRYLGIAWGLYLALALMLTVYVWDYYWNFLRGASELGVLSLLLVLLAPLRWRRAALVGTLALWALTSFVTAPISTPLF